MTTRSREIRRHFSQSEACKRATAGILLGMLLGGTAMAQPAVSDCPLREKPFSMDLPMMDILSSPAAMAVIRRDAPSVLQQVPPKMLKPDPPSFAAVRTLRTLAQRVRLSAETIEQLDQTLAAIPVSAADQALRCARYDNEVPQLPALTQPMRILVFTKINGFDHGEGVTAATAAILKIVARQGWGIAVTDRGGAFTPKVLEQFDVVVWNNISGDVLTLAQRQAFKEYIEQGGGFVGLHAAAGDSFYLWEWYAKELLAARFIGHPLDPQLQTATLEMERSPTGIGTSLPTQWELSDEWYSFAESPRQHGASVVATLDESSYNPVGRDGEDFRMGNDHPIVWTRCVGNGRSFYSALGHLPKSYEDANHLALLTDGLRWAGGKGSTTCDQDELIQLEQTENARALPSPT